MNWLLWRDYRLNRLILVIGAVLLVLPHLLALVLIYAESVPHPEGVTREAFFLAFSAVYSLASAQLTMAMLGGNAIAGQRSDRSAEYLAYLPLAPTRRLCSQITLLVSALAVIWIPNILIMVFAAATPEMGRFQDILLMVVIYAAVTGLTFYCVSWSLSAFLSSPTFSISGGLITPYLVFLACLSLAWYLGFAENEVAPDWYPIACLTLAAVSYGVGTWHYLRRVEP